MKVVLLPLLCLLSWPATHVFKGSSSNHSGLSRGFAISLRLLCFQRLFGQLK